MAKLFSQSLLILFACSLATPALATAPKKDAQFEARFQNLSKRFQGALVVGKKSRKAAKAGPTNISSGRTGIYVPEVLSSQDLRAVLVAQFPKLKKCYLASEKEDAHPKPVKTILELSVRRNGRVSEVDVLPRRIKRSSLGRCILRLAPTWRFPQFTGEGDDGITQEAINASFPLSFQ